MSITVGEEGWTSVVTISSTMGNIDSMFQCREKLLEKLFRSTVVIKRGKQMTIIWVEALHVCVHAWTLFFCECCRA